MDVRPSDEEYLKTGTAIHSAQSGTAVDIHHDLQRLRGVVVGMENELIRCMESGEARRMADIAELDGKLEEARRRLTDLEETQEFVLTKQRERAQQDNRDLSSLIYLVKWGSSSAPTTSKTSAAEEDLLRSGEKPAAPPGFNGSQIAEYVRDLTTMHQTTGATGVLYVLRGWFAGYTEADGETIFKMARNLKLDKESTDRFDRVVIVEREKILPARRRYPNDALKVVHLESQQSVVQSTPEASILREMAHLMNLDMFVPGMSVANRGTIDRVGEAVYEEALELNHALVASVIKGSASLLAPPTDSSTNRGSVVVDPTRRVEGALLATSPASLTNSNRAVVTQVRGVLDRSAAGGGSCTSLSADLAAGGFPTVQRLLVSIAPQLTLYECGLPTNEVARIIEKVYQLVLKNLVYFTNSQYRCGTAGPHTMDTGILLVVDTSNVAHTVQLVVDLFKDILSKDGEIKAFYKPVVAMHSSLEVGTIMNGLCTVVGPGLRYMRRLVGLCRQEGYPMLMSYTAADRADRQRCATVGSYLIDRDPSELFIPTDLEKVRYAPEAELFKQLHAVAEQEFDTHVEGPGPIEPHALTTQTTAQDRHHQAQRVKLVAERTRKAEVAEPEESPYFTLKGMTSLTEIQDMYAGLLARAEAEYQSVLDARQAVQRAGLRKTGSEYSDDDEEDKKVTASLNGIPWDLFETFYHSHDTLGVPASSAAEIRSLIEATTDGMAIHPKDRLALQQEQKQQRQQGAGELVSFEQFCAAMYHILKR